RRRTSPLAHLAGDLSAVEEGYAGHGGGEGSRKDGAEGLELNLDIDAGRQLQPHERVHRLRGRVQDVDQALVRADLERLARVLVDVRGGRLNLAVLDLSALCVGATIRCTLRFRSRSSSSLPIARQSGQRELGRPGLHSLNGWLQCSHRSNGT